jgi:hypothetical protein
LPTEAQGKINRTRSLPSGRISPVRSGSANRDTARGARDAVEAVARSTAFGQTLRQLGQNNGEMIT